MLKKLFRYDFKWLMKTMPYYYIAVLVTAVCALVTNKTYNAHPAVFGWLIVDKISSNLFLAACFAAGITLVIRCFVRFKNNLFKDEALKRFPDGKSCGFQVWLRRNGGFIQLAEMTSSLDKSGSINSGFVPVRQGDVILWGTYHDSNNVVPYMYSITFYPLAQEIVE